MSTELLDIDPSALNQINFIKKKTPLHIVELLQGSLHSDVKLIEERADDLILPHSEVKYLSEKELHSLIDGGIKYEELIKREDVDPEVKREFIRCDPSLEKYLSSNRNELQYRGNDGKFIKR